MTSAHSFPLATRLGLASCFCRPICPLLPPFSSWSEIIGTSPVSSSPKICQKCPVKMTGFATLLREDSSFSEDFVCSIWTGLFRKFSFYWNELGNTCSLPGFCIDFHAVQQNDPLPFSFFNFSFLSAATSSLSVLTVNSSSFLLLLFFN